MNPLTEIIPARARKYVYGVIALAALVWGVWEASGGKWQSFVGGLIVALVNATAASNAFDAVAVKDDNSPTGAVAGESSDLPNGTPVETTPADPLHGGAVRGYGDGI